MMAKRARATNDNADLTPPVAGDADTEEARRLFAQSCTFVAGAARIDQLPAPDLPEGAFAGRSNVGKSS